MLSVPSLTQMLTVIGVALLSTAVLVVLMSVLIGRVRTTATLGHFTAQIPAQRQRTSKSPVSMH